MSTPHRPAAGMPVFTTTNGASLPPNVTESILCDLARSNHIGIVEAMEAATCDQPEMELEWPDWALATLCQQLVLKIDALTEFDGTRPKLIPVDSVEHN